jgi:hypothetical protein
MYHELMTGVTGMIKNAVYRLLERPWVYRLSQLLLSVGAKNLPLRIKQLLLQLPPAQRILDIGCGPSSYLIIQQLLGSTESQPSPDLPSHYPFTMVLLTAYGASACSIIYRMVRHAEL